MENGGPYFENEFKEFFSKAKKKAMEFFNKTAVGEVKDEFIENLKGKMKSRYDMLKQDNDHTCE